MMAILDLVIIMETPKLSILVYFGALVGSYGSFLSIYTPLKPSLLAPFPLTVSFTRAHSVPILDKKIKGMGSWWGTHHLSKQLNSAMGVVLVYYYLIIAFFPRIACYSHSIPK